MSRKKRILIVDDSPFSLQVAQFTLQKAGYEVITAHDLSQIDGLNLDADSAVDLILMDVQMPEAFGDDVAMVLRSVRNIQAPILLLSNLDERELAQRAKEAGIEGYISKRAGADELVRKVRDVIGPE